MKEERLEEIREQAQSAAAFAERSADVAGGLMPRRVGYYGQAVVRPPVWTWEIPVYFFIGGAGGMAAVISLGATLIHNVDLARTSILISVVAAILSPILLILDLGRPARFLNMLRVFKPQSAMSVGAWLLVFFSSIVAAAFIALELQLPAVAATPLLVGAALLGSLLATYTGVLLGVTTVPAWFTHHRLLPVHFGTAGLGSAAAMLELLGHRIAPLNALGLVAAGAETILAVSLFFNRHGASDRALHVGPSGRLLRAAEILSGPAALILRVSGLIPLAAICFLLGALLSRFGWLAAGKISGRDPEAVFATQRA